MEIVLRNTTTRKDAVYLLQLENGVTTGFWGEFETYWNGGRQALRSQVKADRNRDLLAFPRVVFLRILQEKVRKGCRVTGVLDMDDATIDSWLRQHTSYPTGIANAPETFVPQWDPALTKHKQTKPAPRRIVAEMTDDGTVEIKAREPKTRAAWLEL